MSGIDGKVRGLGREVIELLRSKGAQPLQALEIAQLEAEILKDGQVSAAEIDLINELASRPGELALSQAASSEAQTLVLNFAQDAQSELAESQQRLQAFSQLTQDLPQRILTLQAESERFSQALAQLSAEGNSGPEAQLAQLHKSNSKKALSIYQKALAQVQSAQMPSQAESAQSQATLSKLKKLLQANKVELKDEEIKQLSTDIKILQGVTQSGIPWEPGQLQALFRTVRTLNQQHKLFGQLFPNQPGLLRRLELLKDKTAFLDSSLMIQHLDGSKPNPQSEKTLLQLGYLLELIEAPQNLEARHVSVLAALSLSMPAELASFKSLMPPKSQALLERLQANSATLGQSEFIKALADPQSAQGQQIADQLNTLLKASQAEFGVDQLKSVAYLVLSARQDIELLKPLLPMAIQSRLQKLLEQTAWMQTSSSLQGLKDPAVIKDLSESIGVLSALTSPDASLGVEQVQAVLKLYKHARTDIVNFKPLMPAKAQTLLDSITGRLDKYSSLEPQQFDKLLKAVETLTNAEATSDDLYALQDLLTLVKNDGLQLLKDLLSFMPKGMQDRVKPLIESNLTQSQAREAVAALLVLSDSQLNAEDAEAVFKLVSLLKTNAPKILEWLPSAIKNKAGVWVERVTKFAEKLETLDSAKLQQKVFDTFKKHPKLMLAGGAIGATAVLGYILSDAASKAWKGEYGAAAESLANTIKQNSHFFLTAEGQAVLGSAIDLLNLDQAGRKLFETALTKGLEGSDEGMQAIKQLGENYKGKLTEPQVPKQTETPKPADPAKPVEQPPQPDGENQTPKSAEPLKTPPLSEVRATQPRPTDPQGRWQALL